MADDETPPDEGARTRHGGDRHEGPSRTSPYPVSRLAPAHDLVDVAREIERADQTIGAVVGGKLELIARQIRALQEEAREILDDTRRDLDLHRAECNFAKRVGGVYHLYERPNGRCYFSMLSPDDWGGAPPHSFRGSYRLEGDQSWTPAAQIEGDAERPEALVRRLLESGEQGG
ncbi:MAG TPA: DUF2452 domain-containing protein [Sandaracinaceae bacterium LLY-WYZ-13_1]|nr:DUF2452 domain-containing protein [Sandaracinaceae bacterium LLY-WYZ-13_1]